MRTLVALLIALPLLAACNTAPATSSAALADARGHHVMIGTNDYDGTLRWYQHVLEFNLVSEWRIPTMRNAKLAYLEKNGFLIEVIASKDVRPNRKQGKTPNGGYGHYGLIVADVDGAFAVATARGAAVVEAPRASFRGNYRVAFIADNNGNVIELANGPVAE